VKAGVAVTPIDRLELGLRATAQSGQLFRGDEANLVPELDGFVVLSATASYRVIDELMVFVKADNLLGSEYETFGVIADPSEVLPQYENPRFVSPGPPFALWAGIVIEGP
jgi:iron complex outermembrane recepter protein